jgi:hypothetical protein
MSLSWPGDFPSYENYRYLKKTIFYTLIAYLPYVEKFNVTTKSLTEPVLFNEQYREMNDTVLSNFLKQKTKIFKFKILQRIP